MSKPVAIDLFCGLGGWTEGLIAEGYDVTGYDIEAHEYGDQKYPARLVLRDVLTIHGSEFKNAALIVASPPCQEYSYMAMPFRRGKQIAAALRGQGEFPNGYTGSRTVEQLNVLFNACFRIQREASEAAGRRIPMVVENVKGAQPWVGKAKANFGSFYLWGDVDMVGDRIIAGGLRWDSVRAAKTRASVSGDGDRNHLLCAGGRKVPGMNFHEFAKTGQPGRSFQSAAVAGIKVALMTGWDKYGEPGYKPMGFNVEAARRFREEHSGTKGMSGLRGMSHPEGGKPRDLGGPNDPRRFNSKFDSRKAASAQIAKIPFSLSSYIARAYKT